MARPSKLTPEVQERIVDAILHGATYRDASEAAGIAYNTFNEWMKKGADAKTGKFREFNDSVETANAQCAVNFTRVIQSKAAQGDWKAAEAWLKRRRREDWGDNVEIRGDKESPLEIGVRLIDYRVDIAPPESGSSEDSETPSQDKNTGDGA